MRGLHSRAGLESMDRPNSPVEKWARGASIVSYLSVAALTVYLWPGILSFAWYAIWIWPQAVLDGLLLLCWYLILVFASILIVLVIFRTMEGLRAGIPTFWRAFRAKQ